MKVSIQIQGFNGVTETIPEDVEVERIATVLGLRGSSPSMLHRVIFPEHDTSVLVNFTLPSVKQPYHLTFERISTGVRMFKLTVDPVGKMIHMDGHMAYCPHPATLSLAESFNHAGPTIQVDFSFTAGASMLQSVLEFPFKGYDTTRQAETFSEILDDCVNQGYTWIRISDRPPRFKLI